MSLASPQKYVESCIFLICCELFVAIFLKWGKLTKDEKGWTPLHHMAYSDNIEMVKNILIYDRKIPKKSDIDFFDFAMYDAWLTLRDNCGYTPIHIAAQFGSIQVFTALWGMMKEENMTHLQGYRGICRRELRENISPHNRTDDGQFSFFCQFLHIFW